MSALQIGAERGLEAYRGSAVTIPGSSDTSYAARVYRYTRNDIWYRNRAFDDWSSRVALNEEYHNLYRHIRSIYNPIHRLVNLETAKTYGGQIDWTGGLATGAIPVIGADDTLRAAIIQIFKWSNMGMAKEPYVRSGAKLGDRYWKIVDDTARGRVRMEVLNPARVRAVVFDEVGNIKAIALQWYDIGDDGKSIVLREEIDGNEFRYWIDKNLSAFDNGTRRAPDVRHPNHYGFVTVKHSPHIKEDFSDFGRTSFEDYIGKIVQLNDIASPTHDAVRITVKPIYAAIGGVLPDTQAPERERDKVPVINVPVGGDFKPLSPNLDLMGALATMDKLIGELERDMPQLALARIREGQMASGVAIENSYSDASDLLLSVQGNCDEGLIGAVKMAISVAAYRQYERFRMYDPVKSYERGDLDFYIKARDVFSDRLGKKDRLTLLNDSADKKTFRYNAQQLGVSDEDIDDMESVGAEQEANATRGLSDSIFGKAEFDQAQPTAPTTDITEEVLNEDA